MVTSRTVEIALCIIIIIYLKFYLVLIGGKTIAAHLDI